MVAVRRAAGHRDPRHLRDPRQGPGADRIHGSGVCPRQLLPQDDQHQERCPARADLERESPRVDHDDPRGRGLPIRRASRQCPGRCLRPRRGPQWTELLRHLPGRAVAGGEARGARRAVAARRTQRLAADPARHPVRPRRQPHRARHVLRVSLGHGDDAAARRSRRRGPADRSRRPRGAHPPAVTSRDRHARACVRHDGSVAQRT